MDDVQVSRTRMLRWEERTPAVQVSRTIERPGLSQNGPGGRVATAVYRGPVEHVDQRSKRGEDRAVVAVEPVVDHYNPSGIVHGGLGLCDGCRGQTLRAWHHHLHDLALRFGEK